MAEFLILKRDHWATEKPASWSQEKFDARQMAGDIVEVQEDGFYHIVALNSGRKRWDRDAFAVVRVPGLNVATARAKVGSYTSSITGNLLRKFRFSVVSWAGFNWVKTPVTINGRQCEEWYIDINKLSNVGILDKAT